jgi:hypothetical protein
MRPSFSVFTHSILKRSPLRLSVSDSISSACPKSTTIRVMKSGKQRTITTHLFHSAFCASHQTAAALCYLGRRWGWCKQTVALIYNQVHAMFHLIKLPGTNSEREPIVQHMGLHPTSWNVSWINHQVVINLVSESYLPKENWQGSVPALVTEGGWEVLILIVVTIAPKGYEKMKLHWSSTTTSYSKLVHSMQTCLYIYVP